MGDDQCRIGRLKIATYIDDLSPTGRRHGSHTARPCEARAPAASFDRQIRGQPPRLESGGQPDRDDDFEHQSDMG